MRTSGRIEQLLDAAEQRMRTGGYHAVSFRDVANDVGIRSASVHHYFPQKADLGAALVERYRERFFASLANTEGTSAHTRARAFCEAYRDAFRADDTACLCGMLGAESGGLPDPVRAAVRGFFAVSIAWLADTLPAAWPEARRRAEAASMVAALQGAMVLAATFGDPGLLDGTVERVLERHGTLTVS
jgi:TetR/AcrR family transcriptional regulator, transcriptional repressor for nem operon